MSANAEIPNLHVVEKLMTIPLVSSTSATCSSLYQSVKGSSPNVSGAFGLVESMLGQALGAVATTLKDPLVQVDSKLCQGLDTLQEKVPIVKEQPQEIYNRAKTAVNTTLHIDPVWSKTNQLLTSEYGTVVLTGFDTTVDFADKCIDYYLPNDDEETETGFHPSEDCEDKLMHIFHTIGSINKKAGHRIYRTLSSHMSQPSRDEPRPDANAADGQQTTK